MRIPFLPSGIEDSIPDGIDLPQISTSTAAGIGVAIAGNVLISLALNCQKLAHKRLEDEREAAAQAPRPLLSPDSDGRTAGNSSTGELAQVSVVPAVVVETEPLLGRAGRAETIPRAQDRKWLFFRRKTNPFGVKEADHAHLASTHALLPVDGVPVASNGSSPARRSKDSSQAEPEESNYLKSKLWWLGFLLMNLGETGNFISYAFAPASLVAPLGTFALIANCIFAPLMLNERFRKRDFLGIIIAILGAVTVVLSANPSDTRLDQDGLIKAITQRPFQLYTLVYIVGIIILSSLSEGPTGKQFVYVDVGLCALFGGFTVLSTKAFSTLLTLEWLQIFTEWITYPTVAILVGTGVGQIKYLNRALMRFDSKLVVPTQFVLFNLSAIVGSALLYGDFKKATFHQMVTFLYGCGATFAGVFLIAWAPAPPPHHENVDEEDEGDDTYDTHTLRPKSRSPISVIAADGTGPAVARARVGSAARRRPPLVIPEAGSQEMPVIRTRKSVVSLYGFSPAQRVLLIGSSPQEELFRPLHDPERDPGVPAPATTPESLSRRRAVNWLDSEFGGWATPASSARRYGATASTAASAAASREPSRVRDRTQSSPAGPARPGTSRASSVDPFA
ncbi:DUF803-domain-containing protein [Epithele typhae]|uniref:DUF803-domain-containing protein n=1 Tax=Epithele typhae TaxID=378194 RepID=UPI00200870C0|nr:DUF803-domain-containing protein [Epithele typhae]KAH9927128.1 DUF803-domain-containing protein [Epithele typhae]